MKAFRSLAMALVSSSLALGITLANVTLAQTQPAGAVVPQGGGFTSKPVLASPITGVDGKEVVLIAVTLEPGASSPLHTHPGDCYGSVIEGTIELRVDGREPRLISAGESYATLASPAHQFVNVGNKPVRLLNTLVVEKGKPRTVTVPAAGK